MKSNLFARHRRSLVGALVATLGAGLAVPAAAQANWPSRPIKLMVPYAAGGSTDILSRLLAERLTEKLGQQVLVENRGGAGGSVGATAFVKSAADDHSFMMVTQSQISINQFLFKDKLGYDPVADLQPVGLVAQTTNAIVASSSLPVTTFKGLIDYAKANPGKVAYSSAGVGSTGHLLNELMKTTLGIDIVHVPYKGNGPAMQAVVAGEVQFNTDNMPQLLQQIKGGKVKPLAVTTDKRWFQLPDVPTVVELGYPKLVTVVWFGLVAQKSMPRETLLRMNKAVNEILAQPQFNALLRENSLEATPGTPEQMSKLAATERVRWKAVVEASGATTE
ncbi:Bug family tripartite tricarboxylate transporter substrate binding protein [Piscinibacter koreensis]|uniref:Tripartite tricarboxylate transporter substrate binding protein n=1 Tax=Piscinibacter koreensis TaxID=2742824 RepID=A0A7Y6NN52_9BURK|nr:tripartite tricarboxylate transporter substrate binding protein [Schlegelella koreensis]NUZ06149.1 tripartite tricarboxylate transporter substrate binding protein [Schlegelella koreensis]